MSDESNIGKLVDKIGGNKMKKERHNVRKMDETMKNRREKFTRVIGKKATIIMKI